MNINILPNVVPRTEPILLAKSAVVSEAARLMHGQDVGAVLIIENEKLVGIFTERDVSFRVIAEGRNPDVTTLGEVMTPDPLTVQAGETVLAALERMTERNFRHLPVFDGPELVGVVAVRDILADATRQISDALVAMSVAPPPDLRVAGDIMRTTSLVALPPDASVRRAAEVMKDNDIGAVVITEGAGLKGIFTERDVSFRVVSEGCDPDKTPLRDVMSTEPVTIRPGNSCADVVEKMRSGNFRHLPVHDGDRLIGMVSIRDLNAYFRHTLETHFENAMIARARNMIATD